MPTGPCLCGDPYCGSCGNPSLAQLEDAAQALDDAMDDIKATPDEYNLIIQLAPALIKGLRRLVEGELADRLEGYGRHLEWLESRILSLEGEMKK